MHENTLAADLRLSYLNDVSVTPTHNVDQTKTKAHYSVTVDSKLMSQSQGDVIYAGHYIAMRRDHYEKNRASDDFFGESIMQ
jgi:hypothetical protein